VHRDERHNGSRAQPIDNADLEKWWHELAPPQTLGDLLQARQTAVAWRALVKAMTVSERFDKFLSNIALTSDQQSDGTTKHSGVRTALNKHYYDNSSATANSMLVGSWGKDTRIRPPRDIDILCELPYSVYQRFEQRSGNKQAQLLQEVRGVLENTYPNTTMRADGQVVIVPFVTYAVEVLPAFLLDNKKYWICDTNEGGKYKTTDPIAEIAAVHNSATATNGNTRKLIRMLKKWQDVCSVTLKSFMLELLVIEFLSKYEYASKTSVYYDWMVRDFLAWLLSNQTYSWSGVSIPGTGEYIVLGSDWHSKAESAHSRAKKACEYESQNMPYNAGGEWQKIFGDDIPAG
jgi:hypothetical protein